MQAYKDKKVDGVVVLPPIDINQTDYNIVYHSDEQLALDESESIRRLYRTPIRNFKVTSLGLDEEQLSLIDTEINLDPRTCLLYTSPSPRD